MGACLEIGRMQVVYIHVLYIAYYEHYTTKWIYIYQYMYLCICKININKENSNAKSMIKFDSYIVSDFMYPYGVSVPSWGCKVYLYLHLL